MNEESIFENHSAHNSFMALNGLYVNEGQQVSTYITIVKVKKMIRHLTDDELKTVNEIVFSNKLNKYNTLTREKLIGKLSNVPYVRLLRALYVREDDGAVDAILCMLNRKKYHYDLRFLNYFFTYGSVPVLNGGK